jgi:hypothetical protein
MQLIKSMIPLIIPALVMASPAKETMAALRAQAQESLKTLEASGCKVLGELSDIIKAQSYSKHLVETSRLEQLALLTWHH